MSNDNSTPSRRSILGTTGLALAGAVTGTAAASDDADEHGHGNEHGRSDDQRRGHEHGRDEVESVIADWEEKQRQTAREIMDKYGVPEGVTARRLIWYDSGPWKRTELFREAVPHNFPKSHPDFLEQVIDYQVPTEKADELLEYDGSVMFERTKGELSARCDQEPANFLAINLAHDIVTERKSIEEARREYAETMQRMMAGQSPAYVQGLQFDLPEGNQRDPDEAIMDG